MRQFPAHPFRTEHRHLVSRQVSRQRIEEVFRQQIRHATPLFRESRYWPDKYIIHDGRPYRYFWQKYLPVEAQYFLRLGTAPYPYYLGEDDEIYTRSGRNRFWRMNISDWSEDELLRMLKFVEDFIVAAHARRSELTPS